jgi:hypothetical protein
MSTSAKKQKQASPNQSQTAQPTGKSKIALIDPKLKSIMNIIKSNDNGQFTKLGILQEKFFSVVCMCATKLRLEHDNNVCTYLRKMIGRISRFFCKECKREKRCLNVHEGRCAECNKIFHRINDAIQQRYDIAKICPASEIKIKDYKSYVETWKDLAVPFMKFLGKYDYQIAHWIESFEAAVSFFFDPNTPNSINDEMFSKTYYFIFKEEDYRNKVALKVSFRNFFMPIVEDYIERQSYYVPPFEPNRDEEMEKIWVLKKIFPDFKEASNIRNLLQYDHKILPEECRKKNDIMAKLVGKLDKGKSEKFLGDVKQLFTSCFPTDSR